jgi:transcriptional regulator with XRE-family HTH domain
MVCGLSELRIIVAFWTFLSRWSPTQLAPPVVFSCVGPVDSMRAADARLAITLNLAELPRRSNGSDGLLHHRVHFSLEPLSSGAKVTQRHTTKDVWQKQLTTPAGRVTCCATCNERLTMAREFGQTVREMREARNLGLRAAAEHLGISPAYLSRIERGKERPPKPELIKKIARLLGGDADLLFRLGTSTDPDIAEYMNLVPNVPEFLRTAMALRLTSDDFDKLIDHLKRRSA